MSALNSSRDITDLADEKEWQDKPLFPEFQRVAPFASDNTAESAYHRKRSDAYGNEGFSLEHQIRTLQQVAERHERQIVALSTDKHHHCDNLAVVYEQLERVLEKFRLPSSATLGQSPGLHSNPWQLSGTLVADGGSSAMSSGSLASSSNKKAVAKLDELLCHHRDEIFDVLADFRNQIDMNDRETKRRLEAVELSIAHLQGEVRQLHQALSSTEDSRQRTEKALRDEVDVVRRHQETQRAAQAAAATEHAEKVQHCCDTLSACLAQLSEETKAIKKQQQRSEKELDRQIRSIVSTEQQVAEVLERQSQSITHLETQDSLEGAFHEVKDWLGDLEKRMVSRGELLQWSEALREEMRTLRRAAISATVPNGSADVATAAAAGVTSPPRPEK